MTISDSKEPTRVRRASGYPHFDESAQVLLGEDVRGVDVAMRVQFREGITNTALDIK